MTECGLYLHIPFCEKRCHYCDFYSNIKDDEVMEKYVDALCLEIKNTAERFQDINIRTIYLGGGTPSLLSLNQLDKIFSRIYSSFSVHSEETTIEVNPNSSQNIPFYRSFGIDRISIGVQSLSDRTLKLLGRLHSSKEAIKSLQLASAYFDNVSGDLIISVEKGDDIKKNVEGIADYVSHISGYILSVPNKTKIKKMVDDKKLILPSDDESADQYDKLYQVCRENGFYRYETSNFAKIGCEGKHNFSYWTMKPYLGLGPSAHSYYGGRRFYNQPDLKKYIEGENLGFGKEKSERKPSVMMDIQETIMLALRTAQGLNISEFNQKFNRDFCKDYRSGIEAVKKYIAFRDDRLYILPKYFSVQNSIILSILTD